MKADWGRDGRKGGNSRVSADRRAKEVSKGSGRRQHQSQSRCSMTGGREESLNSRCATQNKCSIPAPSRRRQRSTADTRTSVSGVASGSYARGYVDSSTSRTSRPTRSDNPAQSRTDCVRNRVYSLMSSSSSYSSSTSASSTSRRGRKLYSEDSASVSEPSISSFPQWRRGERNGSRIIQGVSFESATSSESSTISEALRGHVGSGGGRDRATPPADFVLPGKTNRMHQGKDVNCRPYISRSGAKGAISPSSAVSGGRGQHRDVLEASRRLLSTYTSDLATDTRKKGGISYYETRDDPYPSVTSRAKELLKSRKTFGTASTTSSCTSSEHSPPKQSAIHTTSEANKPKMGQSALDIELGHHDSHSSSGFSPIVSPTRRVSAERRYISNHLGPMNYLEMFDDSSSHCSESLISLSPVPSSQYGDNRQIPSSSLSVLRSLSPPFSDLQASSSEDSDCMTSIPQSQAEVPAFTGLLSSFSQETENFVFVSQSQSRLDAASSVTTLPSADRYDHICREDETSMEECIDAVESMSPASSLLQNDKRALRQRKISLQIHAASRDEGLSIPSYDLDDYLLDRILASDLAPLETTHLSKNEPALPRRSFEWLPTQQQIPFDLLQSSDLYGCDSRQALLTSSFPSLLKLILQSKWFDKRFDILLANHHKDECDPCIMRLERLLRCRPEGRPRRIWSSSVEFLASLMVEQRPHSFYVHTSALLNRNMNFKIGTVCLLAGRKFYSDPRIERQGLRATLPFFASSVPFALTGECEREESMTSGANTPESKEMVCPLSNDDHPGQIPCCHRGLIVRSPSTQPKDVAVDQCRGLAHISGSPLRRPRRCPDGSLDRTPDFVIEFNDILSDESRGRKPNCSSLEDLLPQSTKMDVEEEAVVESDDSVVEIVDILLEDDGLIADEELKIMMRKTYEQTANFDQLEFITACSVPSDDDEDEDQSDDGISGAVEELVQILESCEWDTDGLELIQDNDIHTMIRTAVSETDLDFLNASDATEDSDDGINSEIQVLPSVEQALRNELNEVDFCGESVDEEDLLKELEDLIVPYNIKKNDAAAARDMVYRALQDLNEFSSLSLSDSGEILENSPWLWKQLHLRRMDDRMSHTSMDKLIRNISFVSSERSIDYSYSADVTYSKDDPLFCVGFYPGQPGTIQMEHHQVIGDGESRAPSAENSLLSRTTPSMQSGMISSVIFESIDSPSLCGFGSPRVLPDRIEHFPNRNLLGLYPGTVSVLPLQTHDRTIVHHSCEGKQHGDSHDPWRDSPPVVFRSFSSVTNISSNYLRPSVDTSISQQAHTISLFTADSDVTECSLSVRSTSVASNRSAEVDHKEVWEEKGFLAEQAPLGDIQMDSAMVSCKSNWASSGSSRSNLDGRRKKGFVEVQDSITATYNNGTSEDMSFVTGVVETPAILYSKSWSSCPRRLNSEAEDSEIISVGLNSFNSYRTAHSIFRPEFVITSMHGSIETSLRNSTHEFEDIPCGRLFRRHSDVSRPLVGLDSVRSFPMLSSGSQSSTGDFNNLLDASSLASKRSKIKPDDSTDLKWDVDIVDCVDKKSAKIAAVAIESPAIAIVASLDSTDSESTNVGGSYFETGEMEPQPPLDSSGLKHSTSIDTEIDSLVVSPYTDIEYVDPAIASIIRPPQLCVSPRNDFQTPRSRTGLVSCPTDEKSKRSNSESSSPASQTTNGSCASDDDDTLHGSTFVEENKYSSIIRRRAATIKPFDTPDNIRLDCFTSVSGFSHQTSSSETLLSQIYEPVSNGVSSMTSTPQELESIDLTPDGFKSMDEISCFGRNHSTRTLSTIDDPYCTRYKKSYRHFGEPLQQGHNSSHCEGIFFDGATLDTKGDISGIAGSESTAPTALVETSDESENGYSQDINTGGCWSSMPLVMPEEHGVEVELSEDARDDSFSEGESMLDLDDIQLFKASTCDGDDEASNSMECILRDSKQQRLDRPLAIEYTSLEDINQKQRSLETNVSPIGRMRMRKSVNRFDPGLPRPPSMDNLGAGFQSTVNNIGYDDLQWMSSLSGSCDSADFSVKTQSSEISASDRLCERTMNILPITTSTPMDPNSLKRKIKKESSEPAPSVASKASTYLCHIIDTDALSVFSDIFQSPTRP